MVLVICVFIISITVAVCVLGVKYFDKSGDLPYTRYRELYRELSEIKSLLKDKNGGKE